jgi:hypothetical protein
MTFKQQITSTGYVLMTILIMPVKASAVQVADVRFEPLVATAVADLNLRGAGLLRFLGIFKVYAGAFYLDEDAPLSEALEDRAKRLEVQYFRAFKGEEFGPATIKLMRKNVDEVTMTRIADEIAYHNSLYEDVKPGDRGTLTYLPGRGTELTLNGRVLGVIPGAEFASALFSIWIGAEPIDLNFKRQLLGA